MECMKKWEMGNRMLSSRLLCTHGVMASWLPLLAALLIRELDSKRNSKLGELLHVLKGELGVIDRVARAVNVLVRVLESALDSKGRLVSGLGERGVVTAGIAALGLGRGNGQVGLDKRVEERSEVGVDKVLDNTHDLLGTLLDPGSHVKLDHGTHTGALVLVGLSNSLRAKKTSLLSRVPVELDWSHTGKVCTAKCTERLKHRGRSGSIVVSSRGREEWPHVGRVLVGSDDGDGSILATGVGEASDDRVLSPGVLKLADLDLGVDTGNLS